MRKAILLITLKKPTYIQFLRQSINASKETRLGWDFLIFRPSTYNKNYRTHIHEDASIVY